MFSEILGNNKGAGKSFVTIINKQQQINEKVKINKQIDRENEQASRKIERKKTNRQKKK